MSSSEGSAFTVGFLIGLIVMGCLGNWVGSFNKADLRAAREQCEKALPRDQHCVYQFVPEKKP
ncbi:hypothetical protein FROZEN_33 [Erwinia phage vB_EamP_Frozen]|uniref:Uncharacterized protein n=1 Tax=Erwinia phage vB_EamP_Frozen TaxID=1852641 RepID=A0A191ZCP5_9CAUD|nr:hypothetical protein FROZEN_33 [Erwinia phage vB_EamP_Frozen]ANJ65165.1 hypothetical protein FROZEN_33 [Erwinia phage vB_EamP_Frozen]